MTSAAAPTLALGPAARQASSVGQAGFGPADNQAGPSASAVDQEKAVLPKGNRCTSKSGGEGAAAGERGKSKAEKSKSRKPAKAKLVTPFPKCALLYAQTLEQTLKSSMCVICFPRPRCMPYCKFLAASQPMSDTAGTYSYSM